MALSERFRLFRSGPAIRHYQDHVDLLCRMLEDQIGPEETERQIQLGWERRYARALAYFREKTPSAEETVRTMFTTVVRSGEYERAARRLGGGKMLLSTGYTERLISLLSSKPPHPRESRAELFHDDIMTDYPPERVLLREALGWLSPEDVELPDSHLAIGDTLQTLLAISDEIEAKDRWMDFDFARVQHESDEGGQGGTATESE